jgi:peptidoglycan/LPS O-acetylase OafA/YrhL
MTLSPETRAAGRIPELDGLRGFAVLLVVSIHYLHDPAANLPAWQHRLQSFFGLGWTGVDLFFVLSGFLIVGILLDVRESSSYFKTFYTRRLFRIVPIYYAWIALYVLLVWIGGSFFPRLLQADMHPAIGWAVWRHFLFLQNFRAMDYALLAGYWFGPMWSLAVEEQFYLIAPFVVRLLSRRWLTFFLFGVVVAAPCLRGLLYLFSSHPQWPAYVWMPCRADSLAIGALGAVGWSDPAFRKQLSARRGMLYFVFAGLLIGMAVLGIWFPNPRTVLTQTAGYTWVALFYLSLLFLVLVDTGGPIARLSRMRWLRACGQISYCVYLIHAAILFLCLELLTKGPASGLQSRSALAVVAALAITFGVAKASWILFERPLLQRGHKYKY